MKGAFGKKVSDQLFEGGKRSCFGLLATTFRRGDEKLHFRVQGNFGEKIVILNSITFHFSLGFEQQVLHS